MRRIAGLSQPALRYKLWRPHFRIVQEACDGLILPVHFFYPHPEHHAAPDALAATA